MKYFSWFSQLFEFHSNHLKVRVKSYSKVFKLKYLLLVVQFCGSVLSVVQILLLNLGLGIYVIVLACTAWQFWSGAQTSQGGQQWARVVKL